MNEKDGNKKNQQNKMCVIDTKCLRKVLSRTGDTIISNNMPVPASVQKLLTKSTTLYSSRLECQFARQCVRTNVKSRCMSN